MTEEGTGKETEGTAEETTGDPIEETVISTVTAGGTGTGGLD